MDDDDDDDVAEFEYDNMFLLKKNIIKENLSNTINLYAKTLLH
jgi:hypothetical protein